MKTKLFVLTVGVVVIWSMKRYYADAAVDDLWWILSPTARRTFANDLLVACGLAE